MLDSIKYTLGETKPSVNMSHQRMRKITKKINRIIIKGLQIIKFVHHQYFVKRKNFDRVQKINLAFYQKPCLSPIHLSLDPS